MLNNFFRINLPYGIACNNNDEWMAFNREYLPLGYNDEAFCGDPGQTFSELPIYTKYEKLSLKFLMELAESEDRIGRDESGKIVKVFLYNDGTNPTNSYNDNTSKLWDRYFEKLRLLAKLKISNQNVI